MQTSAFDTLARDYDSRFTASPLGRALRARVWRRLEDRLAHCRHVLELGCGTGEDAVHLARRGLRVLATDASARMIAIAREKAESAGVTHLIRFVHAPMETLDEHLGEERFDGVYSNFGALNCVADLESLGGWIASRLSRGAPLVLVVMGRTVPWEWAWFLARRDRHSAFRRRRPAGVVWRDLRIRYHTPAEFARILGPRFIVDRREGLGSVLPPSYAAGWLERSPRVLRLLERVDRASARFTANVSDHYIVEAIRGAT